MTDQFSFIDPDSLTAVPSTKWLVEGLIPLKEITMICGAPKHLKTMCLVSLLCSTAVGRPWFGHQVQQGKVLYVIGEGGDAFLGRVKAWQTLNDVESFGGNFRSPEANA